MGFGAGCLPRPSGLRREFRVPLANASCDQDRGRAALLPDFDFVTRKPRDFRGSLHSAILPATQAGSAFRDWDSTTLIWRRSAGGCEGRHRGVRALEHRGQGYISPIFFGGYPYYYDGSLDYEQPEQVDQSQAYPIPGQPQPQIIVIQQPVPAVAAQRRLSRRIWIRHGAGAKSRWRPVPLRKRLSSDGGNRSDPEGWAGAVCFGIFRGRNAIAVYLAGRDPAEVSGDGTGFRGYAADE